MRYFILCLLAITLAGKAAYTQSFNKEQVVDSLAASLMKNYVFPDTARQMAAYIENQLQQGAYTNVNTAPAFAQALTEGLRHVYNDAHLSVTLKSTPTPAGTRADAKAENFNFRKLEIISGNIGYLAFDRFDAMNDDSRQTVDAAFTFLQYADALIIDLRSNGGGSPDMNAYICSYLLPPGTQLSSTYERNSNTTDTYYTKANKLSFVGKPIYILTSRLTFSCAENFAYDLQQLRRAVIIGETTGGGAHVVGQQDISNGFIALVPYGRAISPITGTNWETIGVKPDIATSSDSALNEAILGFYNYQASHLTDTIQVKKIAWARDMLDAKLHPFTIDTTTLSTYTGKYGTRAVTLENGGLQYIGGNGKKSALLPMAKDTFRISGMDYVKVVFTNTAMLFIFEDGFVSTYARTP